MLICKEIVIGLSLVYVNGPFGICSWIEFTFMHLSDAFIQSDLVHSGFTFV